MFTFENNELIKTKEVQIKYKREDLIQDKERLEMEIAMLQGEINKIVALLSEYDKLEKEVILENPVKG